MCMVDNVKERRAEKATAIYREKDDVYGYDAVADKGCAGFTYLKALSIEVGQVP